MLAAILHVNLGYLVIPAFPTLVLKLYAYVSLVISVPYDKYIMH